MRVNIRLAETIERSVVNTSGGHVNVITDGQQRAFNIQEPQLRRAIQRVRGREPNDVFVRSPTNPPLTVDLYPEFNWSQVQAHLDIMGAQVLDMSLSPEIVAQTDLVNNSSVSGTFRVNLNTTVTDTVTSSWQIQHGIAVGQSVSYSVGTIFGGETSFEYNHTWGEGGEHSRSTSLSTGAEVEVALEPGQAVTASIISNRGQARVQVRYRSRLTGGVAMNYNPRHNNSHFWIHPVGQMMDNIPTPQHLDTVETLQIGMFTSTRVEIRDKETTRLLKTFIIRGNDQSEPDWIIRPPAVHLPLPVGKS
ncbi:hypothetical protein [Phytobacter sp. V91]|uniref:hypothetical protein n=1 Tax=Phytobacter sp. V91 TaxID=3369425 RepID=UPI003F6243EC